MSRVLIATALEETWPPNNEPVLFLGEWCRLYGRKSAWDGLNATVASYHWDNREKLHHDYIYLQALYEELLSELTSSLNETHGVKHSIRYWRILIGPWLGCFIQILFDRWAMLAQVQRDNDFCYISLKEYKSHNLFIPNDFEEFISFFLGDEWNNFLYGQIAEWMRIPTKYSKETQYERKSISTIKSKLKGRRLYASLKEIANYIFSRFGRNDGYFFISTYLGVKQNLRLQFKLGQIPLLWQSVVAPQAKISEKMRKWDLPANGNQEFEHLVRALVPKNVPKLYLEGYSALIQFSNNVSWPKTPKIIFTSNSLISDDVFKAWAAGKVEHGIPLVIGQHGGNYGMALWSFFEDHEIAVADRYLTWGWTKQRDKKVLPIGNFKKCPKTSPNLNGVALLVVMTLPRQSYYMYSVPIGAGQWQAYFQDQLRFAMALPEDLRTKLVIRLSSRDYEYFQQRRWKDVFQNIELDDGSCSISTLMRKSRLYISTYNATTYLESMALNFPTLIFWNPMHWELREEASEMFEKLKKVGIFHETPESAAKHMENIWDDISDWWFSVAVQEARTEFCNKYTRETKDTVRMLTETFLNLS